MPVALGRPDDVTGGLLEDADELAPNDLALLLGVAHSRERRQELLLGVHDDEVDTGGGHELLLDLLGLARAQQPVVDENAGELVTDGALHEIDVRRARVSDSIPVLDAWREPLDWTEPRPTLEVLGSTAYVTDPAASALQVVDLERGEVVATHDLPPVPDELVALPG